MASSQTHLLKHLCQTRFDMFARLATGWLMPGEGLNHHWSSDLIAQTLMRCQSGETTRLIINTPPGMSASLYASVLLPAWALAHRPEMHIHCLAGNRILADEQYDLVARLMSHGQYQAVFRHMRVEHGLKQIKLRHGGCQTQGVVSPAASVGRRSDLLIIDQPVDTAYGSDADRLAVVNRWFDQKVGHRLGSGSEMPVIVVMPRLHVDDLTGHLLEQDGWALLSLPAIAPRDLVYDLDLGRQVKCQKRDVLDPAHKDRDELLETMNRIGAKAFMAQYQQEPYPPGQGEGFSGPHSWLTPVGPEMPGVGERNTVFMGLIPQEKIVANELFHGRASLPQSTPGLRDMTEEEWHQNAMKVRRMPASGG